MIKLDGSGKERTLLTRSVLRAIQELMRQTEVDDKTRDLASFIVLALEAIHQTIDQSVQAWENRGYWLKADRFRLEWEWAGLLADKMRQAIFTDDWDTVAVTAVKVSSRLENVQLPKRQPQTEPWKGAWEQLSSVTRPK
ncbi:MAG: hypothetical protein B6D39_07755 [Anaerolineae bacterium UTCFX2]|jgi:hypothetical protein|nr:MAG: hypothetical protein B6D39_07755 [Anaerolineae bacterium UTCFX2]